MSKATRCHISCYADFHHSLLSRAALETNASIVEVLSSLLKMGIRDSNSIFHQSDVR